MICAECEVLVELVREVNAVCVRKGVPNDERKRRLRWAMESFECCCVAIDVEAMEPVRADA